MNETGDARSAPAAALDRSTLPSPYIQWGPTLGGGLVAAAVFFVLMTFATAVGLAVSSVSPTRPCSFIRRMGSADSRRQLRLGGLYRGTPPFDLADKS